MQGGAELIRKIISGGQTGADRGALEAAHDLGIERGGWAPEGWRAEDGLIPEWYRRGMLQAGSSAYRIRTRANIEEAHGTLIISFGDLQPGSGSMKTSNIARTLGKPCLAIQIPRSWVGLAVVRDWLEYRKIAVLNVAGPRESREPGIQAAARAALIELLLPQDEALGWDLPA